MTQSKIKGLGGRVALLAALSVLMVGASASAASAEVKLSESTGLPEETSITVSGGTAPTGTQNVAISVCAAALPGKQCDRESGTGESFVSGSEYAEGVLIPVRRSWAGFDFTLGLPAQSTGNETTCYSEGSKVGDPCDVIVSFYSASFKHLGSEPASIEFE